jgi:DNA-binding NarL/FixJ family response regulator
MARSPIARKVATMSRMRSYLAGVASTAVPSLVSALGSAGYQLPVIAERISVTELGLSRPDILIADIDGLETDPIETLRMMRFVLPDCMIAIYTKTLTRLWARACHLGGANSVLSKESSETELVVGLKQTMRLGCFTDPKFAA